MRRFAALALVALLAAACGGDDGDGGTDDNDDGAASSSGCAPAIKPAETPRSFDAEPPDCLEDGIDYGAVVTTSEGAFTVDRINDLGQGDGPPSTPVTIESVEITES